MDTTTTKITASTAVLKTRTDFNCYLSLSSVVRSSCNFPLSHFAPSLVVTDAPISLYSQPLSRALPLQYLQSSIIDTYHNTHTHPPFTLRIMVYICMLMIVSVVAH